MMLIKELNIKECLCERTLVSDYASYNSDVIGNYTLNVFNI